MGVLYTEKRFFAILLPMYEIELKAHVYNRDELIPKLNADARYLGTAEKNDTYWRLTAFVRDAAIDANGKAGNVEKSLTVRIRTECTVAAEKGKTCRHLVTYKEKHRECKENPALEVNDEKEFAVSDRAEFERFLHKAGFEAVYEKHKKSMQWEKGDALIELCTVEPLGDFLEMEILAETADENRVKKTRLALEKLLKKYGIPLEQIEPMYYSELLKAKKFL